MSARRVTVEIDELVLIGFERRDRDAIASTLRGELAWALGNGEPSQPRDAGVDARAGVGVPLEYAPGPRASAESIGRSAARAIAAHLTDDRSADRSLASPAPAAPAAPPARRGGRAPAPVSNSAARDPALDRRMGR